MELGLEGKVALVAAASRGLGYAVARALAAEGVRVSIVSRDGARIQEAARRIRDETAADVLAIAADIRSADAIAEWVKRTRERLGGVDLLFTNAGGPPAGTFESLTDDKVWYDAFDLLVLSAVRMVRAAIPLMRERGGGSMVLSTSAAVKEPSPNLTLSNVVRASVAALSKTLADEHAKDGIRVNQLIPGRIDTDRVRELDGIRAERSGISVEEVKQRSAAQIPLGRYGDPSEFARAAVFLLSDAASYITGASMQVDGGRLRSVF
ncbi:MAG: SDR family oxidoreductase [Gemmatimonadetes bacterium]|nr:SDR family oxidoreductase [Gemmatimonadota bacterium]